MGPTPRRARGHAFARLPSYPAPAQQQGSGPSQHPSRGGRFGACWVMTDSDGERARSPSSATSATHRVLVIFAALSAGGTACYSPPAESTCAAEGSAIDVCPRGASVQGVGVSVYQGDVGWSQARCGGNRVRLRAHQRPALRSPPGGRPGGSGNTRTSALFRACLWPSISTSSMARWPISFPSPRADPTTAALPVRSMRSPRRWTRHQPLRSIDRSFRNDETTSDSARR
jgi:hypothetical protein